MSIHAVIGIIINPDNQILIAQRLPHQAKGGLWEFPGGKVEPAETAFQALQRELTEEIGIEVVDAEPWIKFEHHYPHASVLLDTWVVKKFNGVPFGAEGQPVSWISITELPLFEFPEGNRIIVEKLLLSTPRYE
jgi:8-oxo-dGTP diphosphatase